MIGFIFENYVKKLYSQIPWDLEKEIIDAM